MNQEKFTQYCNQIRRNSHFLIPRIFANLSRKRDLNPEHLCSDYYSEISSALVLGEILYPSMTEHDQGRFSLMITKFNLIEKLPLAARRVITNIKVKLVMDSLKQEGVM